MEVIRDGVVIDLRDRAFLRTDAAGEVAPVIDCKRKIGIHGFADRLAVVPCLGQRQELEVIFHPLCNLVHQDGAVRGAGMTPALAGGMCCVQCPFNVLSIGARNLAECLPGDWRYVLEILAGSGLDPLAANVVAIARAEAHFIAELARNRFCHGRHRKSSGGLVARNQQGRAKNESYSRQPTAGQPGTVKSCGDTSISPPNGILFPRIHEVDSPGPSPWAGSYQSYCKGRSDATFQKTLAIDATNLC